jgi:nicotinamide mononucleotide transporter
LSEALAFALGTPWPERLAVVLSIAYLLLAVAELRACWIAAFAATLLYLVIFWDVRLYMETGLQLFYLAMAVYGWVMWTRAEPEPPGRATTARTALPVTTWPWQRHLWVLALVGAATLVSGLLLADTDARLPYLDAFTTWGSVAATFMVARKVLENWAYWLVIDSLSIVLYVDRALYLTAALFAFYVVIVCFGWYAWLQSYRREHAAA